MRKTLSIILLIILTISLSGCGNKNLTEKDVLTDPVYEVVIKDTVPSSELIDTFAKYGLQFFRMKYPDLVYAKFYYEGNFDSIEAVDGNMQLTYLATNSGSVLNPPIKLVAYYDKSTNFVNYYEMDTDEKGVINPSAITSARFSEVIEKMKGYFSNLGISSGYLEMTEYAQEEQWIINHFPTEGKYADVQLVIDSVTLELLEYNQNP